MHPDDNLTPPLTLDEAFQVAGFLAERGHTDVAHEIIHSAISANVVSVVAAAHEAAT